MKKIVFFLNDKEKYNGRYRAELMKLLSYEYDVKSVGQETFILFLKCIFFQRALVFSSNLKTNILVLLLRRNKSVVLINGLGRYKRSKIFRHIMVQLCKISKAQIICFQNYSDYRFFSRYCLKKFYWIPGSGGTQRSFSDKRGTFGIITRIRKLSFLSGQLLDVNNKFREQGILKSPLFLIGIDPSDLKKLPIALEANAIGYIEQNSIFEKFQNFIQLPGYGEGIPHSLVDAIASGLNIYITKKSYIEYGLNKLFFKFEHVVADWGKLVAEENSISEVGSYSVNNEYLRLIKKAQES